MFKAGRFPPVIFVLLKQGPAALLRGVPPIG